MGKRSCNWSGRFIYLAAHAGGGDGIDLPRGIARSGLPMRGASRSREVADLPPLEPPSPTLFSSPAPTGVRPHPRLTLEAAAAYATHVDAARVRAATEGRTLIYTIKWI